MMWLRRIILGLPLFLILFFVLAFTAVRVSAPRKLNQFVSGSIGEPEILNPILSTTTAASEVESRVFNGLVRYNENLEIEGDLARSWDIRQSSHLFFSSEAEAEEACRRVVAQRPRWATLALEEADALGAVLHLQFTGAGTSYREELFGWLGDRRPEPVSFLALRLKTEEGFPDGSNMK